MQYTTLFLTSALAALAQAVEFTNPTFATITAGKPFELTWTEASGPVTIILKNGPPTNLQTVSTIQSGLTGNTFTWNVPATLPHDTYALEIQDSTSTPNYSTQFELIGGAPASASASVSGTPTGSVNTASQTGSTTLTGTQTAATTSTGTQTATGTATTGSTRSLVTSTSTRASASATSSPTAAPAGGMASGLTSNLALVFVAVGALFMIN